MTTRRQYFLQGVLLRPAAVLLVALLCSTFSGGSGAAAARILNFTSDDADVVTSARNETGAGTAKPTEGGRDGVRYKDLETEVASAVPNGETGEQRDGAVAGEVGPTASYRRRRAAGECKDTDEVVEYTTSKRGPIQTHCHNVAIVRNNGAVKQKKCQRALADGSGREVRDVCPVACGKCSSEGGQMNTTPASTSTERETTPMTMTITTPSTTTKSTSTTTTETAPMMTTTTEITTTTTRRKSTKERKYSYEHVIDRVDSSASCSPPDDDDDASAVLVAVTNREILIACHSFERYLSHKFRTVFILNGDFAGEWQIDDLVRDATCKQSLGATLLKLDTPGGELLGRRLALEYFENEADNGRVEFLHQMNCDVHPIPERHVLYKPLDETVIKMVADFRVARAQREPRKYRNVNYPSFSLTDNLSSNHPSQKRGILAMAPMLFEDFKSMTKLVTDLHGNDVSKWEENGGPAARPRRFGNYPWLFETGILENHMLIFDIEKLQTVRREYLDAPREAGADSFPYDTRLTPRIAAMHDLTVVYNRDVYAHQGFAESRTALNYYPGYVNKDWVRVQSWAVLAETRGPRQTYDAWNAFNGVGVDPYMGLTAVGFARVHAFSDGPWLPQDLDGESLSRPICMQMVDALMKMFGYELLKRRGDFLDYGLVGSFPANLYVSATTRSSYSVPKDSWEFLQLKAADGRVFRYIVTGSVKSDSMRSMDPESRIVQVPREGTIRRFFGPSEIVSRTYIHTRGRYRRGKSPMCGAPDQDRRTACGYLESTGFDEPY